MLYITLSKTQVELPQQRSIQGLEIIDVGWKDPDERFFFTRKVE